MPAPRGEWIQQIDLSNDRRGRAQGDAGHLLERRQHTLREAGKPNEDAKNQRCRERTGGAAEPRRGRQPAPGFAQHGPFDLVLANILANPLRQLATPMARHLAPGALVILSGLLTHQAPSVIAAYRARGLAPQKPLRIEGWSSLLLHKIC